MLRSVAKQPKSANLCSVHIISFRSVQRSSFKLNHCTLAYETASNYTKITKREKGGEQDRTQVSRISIASSLPLPWWERFPAVEMATLVAVLKCVINYTTMTLAAAWRRYFPYDNTTRTPPQKRGKLPALPLPSAQDKRCRDIHSLRLSTADAKESINAT